MIYTWPVSAVSVTRDLIRHGDINFQQHPPGKQNTASAAKTGLLMRGVICLYVFLIIYLLTSGFNVLQTYVYACVSCT